MMDKDKDFTQDHSGHVSHIWETIRDLCRVVDGWPKADVDQVQCSRAFILAVNLTRALSAVEPEVVP